MNEGKAIELEWKVRQGREFRLRKWTEGESKRWRRWDGGPDRWKEP